MNRQEYHHLLAERSALERMITETPPEDVIDLNSLKARLDIINRQIARQPVDIRLPAKARITYRGRPVIGSHGIFAEFGMAATKAFTDAVTLLAASLDIPLAATGPIPNRTQNQLLITSTAVGSFGFELEEHREGVLPLEDESVLALALKQTQELLQGAAVGSDDDLTDVASGKDPRAITAVRGFLKTLIDNDAVCAVAVGDAVFGFSDVGEVERGWERLAQDNLHEVLESFAGTFEGVLPKRRTFEFRLTDSGEIISGKIGPTISDPAAINRHLYQPIRIEVVAMRVGQGRARYVLNTMPQWSGTSGDESESDPSGRP